MSIPIGEIKVAAGQMEPMLGKLEENRNTILRQMDEAARNGARLIVFPECAMTGYMFTSADEARGVLEPVPGPTTKIVSAAAKKNNIHVVYGALEKDGSKIHNVAVLVGPEGFIGSSRKLQPPHMGIDYFCEPGTEEPRVFQTPIGNIGMMICMDAVYPEHARVLALKGADIFTIPTNTPAGIDHIPRACQPSRAFENHCYNIYANRCGTERGSIFLGMSMIMGVWGEIIIESSRTALDGSSRAKEEIIYAVIKPEEARNKRLQGEGWWADLWQDRRPELYGLVCKPNK